MKTLGHSNRKENEFESLLESSGCSRLVDVRTTANSRFPQFRGNNLKRLAENAGLEYLHLPALGGKNIGSTPYKNLILGSSFLEGFRILEEHDLLMCSEKNPLNCHRFVLLTRFLEREHDVEVVHILDKAKEVTTSYLEKLMCKKLGGIFVSDIEQCYDLRMVQIVAGKMWY